MSRVAVRDPEDGTKLSQTAAAAPLMGLLARYRQHV